ncbi:MAG: hypothetical protein ABJN26_00045 [Stappiaceae bacterium]
MTVSSETSRSGPYIGNGLTTVFAYGFRILEEGHIRVVKLGTDGIEADQVLSADYTVSGIGDANGGNITLLSAPEIGETITIVRNVPLTQGTDFENQGAYFAQTHEDAFDRLSMQMQQVNEAVDRSVKVQVSDDDTDPDALIDSIAASESAAATSAGAAATSAGAASSSETNAAHSATEAAQSAANAGTNVVAAETSPAGLAEGKEWWDSANGKLYVEHEGRLIQANHTTNVPGDADSLQIATNLASINAHNVRLNALEAQDVAPSVIITHTITSGSDGGAVATGVWEARTLNTEDLDVNSYAALSSNQITLAAGTYHVEWRAQYHTTGLSHTRMRNTTTNSTLIVGEGAEAERTSGVGSAITLAGKGRITVADSQVLELQHYCINGANHPERAQGYAGNVATVGENVVFATLTFQRVA